MDKEEANDEINLASVLFRLWKYKFVIIAVIFITCSFSIYFMVIKATKIYSATGIFIAKDNNEKSDLSAFALSKFTNVPGLPSAGSDVDELIEKFTGRNFMLGVIDELKLSNDRFFNTYDPTTTEPAWKAKLKSMISWKSSKLSPDKMAEWILLKNFENRVVMKATKADAIKVTVEHANPERAAEIANYIMNKSILSLKLEKEEKNQQLIDYLSKNLADALIKFEDADEKLKAFMISKSADASARFYKGSIILDKLRPQLQDSKDQISAIGVLLSHAERTSPTFQDYLKLRDIYPVLDQSDFRRILGVSEIRNSWTWPSVETMKRVQSSVRDRERSLEVEIAKYETESKEHAIEADQQNKLLRELKITESVYKLLAEQTKGQSLSVGFTPDNSQVISVAKVEPAPTKPKMMFVVSVAGLLGFFVSALLVLGFSWYKGYIYSKGELLEAIDPKFHHKIGPLRYYRSSSLIEAHQRLIQRPAPWLKQLCLETFVNQGRSIVVIADSTNGHHASIISRIIVASAHEYGKSLAYIDLSKELEFQSKDQNKKTPEPNTNIDVSGCFKDCIEYNYQGGKQNIDWLFSKSFQETLDLLCEKHDMVLFSSNSRTQEFLHSSGKLKQAKLVVYASLGKTKYEKINQLKQQGNIEIALFT